MNRWNRWVVDETTAAGIQIKDEDRKLVCTMRTANALLEGVQIRIDAKRIVDCVNAMEGIEDTYAARVVLDSPETQNVVDVIKELKRIRDIVNFDGGRIDAIAGSIQADELQKIIDKAEGRAHEET